MKSTYVSISEQIDQEKYGVYTQQTTTQFRKMKSFHLQQIGKNLKDIALCEEKIQD